MDSTQRQRLIVELTRLTRSEFEQVVDEVRARPNGAKASTPRRYSLATAPLN
jgi:hypothetical protein